MKYSCQGQTNEDDSIGTVQMAALQIELSIECFMEPLMG